MHEILVFDVSLPESLHDWCLTTNHEVITKKWHLCYWAKYGKRSNSLFYVWVNEKDF